MELINNNYIKVDKLDIFTEIVKASESQNIDRQLYFQKLIGILLEFEMKSKINVSEIFLPKNDFNKREILNIPIKRQTLLNAYIYANISNEITLSTEISKYISKKEVLSNELGNICNYILEHSMNIDEYFDGETLRFIYNSQKNELKKCYVFNLEKPKIRKLK